MAANIVQYTVQWVIDQVTQLDNKAKSQEQVVRAQRARVNAMKASVEKIADATKRVAMRASVAKLETKQLSIEKNWNGFVSKYKSMRNTAIGWLRANGLLKGTTLGELGFVQFAPVLVYGSVLAVGAYLGWMVNQTTAHGAGLSLVGKALDALVNGKINTEQFDSVVNSANRQTEAAAAGSKPDPLGLTGFAEALMPLGMIALGLYIAPKLFKELEHRRERKAVAA